MECLRFIKSIGIAFADRAPNGHQAGHAAAINENVAMLKFLATLSPTASNEDALNLAARHGRLKSLQVLHDLGADMRHVAYTAARHNQLEALNLALTLSGAGDARQHKHVVEVAARCGHVDCLRVLHAAGIDITTDSLRPYETTAAFEAAREGHVEVLRYLHSIGLDLRWPHSDYFNSTPVYVAAAHGHASCVQFLCDECPGVVSKVEIALVALAAVERGRVACLKLCLERGALAASVSDDVKAKLARAAEAQCGFALPARR